MVSLGVITVLFFIFQVAGGDPALVHAGKNADAQTVELLREQMGFTQPLLRQYWQFTADALLWDFGTSWATQRPVLAMIGEGLGPTLSITVISFTLTFLFSLALAFVAIHFRFRFLEKIINASVALLMSLSFIVVILFMQKLFGHTLDWFPVFGWESGEGRWRFVALPCFIYLVGSFSPKFLLFRTLISEELEKKYVLTAQSKGLSWSRIYFVHILKNISATLVALISAQVPALLTGYLLIEVYFGIPGVGHLLLKSIQSSDFPTVKALTLLGALVYIVFVFLGDILVQALSPREETP